MMAIRFFFLSMMLAAAQAASGAVIVASDNFQYGVGPIAGKNGGTGWSGAWNSGQNPATAPQVVDPAVDMELNNALQFTGDHEKAAYRTLGTTLNSGVIVEFLLQYSGRLQTNDFLGLWFGKPQGAPSIGLKTNCGEGQCREDVFARTTGTAGAFLSGSNLSADTTYHVFGYLYKSSASGNYDRFAAWLNPTAHEMLTLTGYDALYAGDSGLRSFNTIGFRAVNLDGGVSVRVDDLRIEVPEPGTIALLSLALLGMVLAGRRKA